MVEMAVSGDQLHAKFLGESDVESVVERQLVMRSQVNHSMDQPDSRHHQFKLKVIERGDRPLNFTLRKVRMMEQGVGHFIDQEVWSSNVSLSVDMGITQRDSERGVRFAHEPLQGDRGVDDRHYRDSRSFLKTFTLSQPGGAFLRIRSIVSAALSIRAWSRGLPLMSNSTAFVIWFPSERELSMNALGCQQE